MSTRPRWYRRRPILAVTAAAGVVALVTVAGTYAVVQLSERSRVVSVADAPHAEVALVLGAGLTAEGTPTLYLERRLEAARQLWERGAVDVVLVSGDNSRTSHDEPTAMRDWLVDHGVPSRVVVRDYAGFDTQDSCMRAREVFGVTSAVVVTQDYHLPRALYACDHAGLDVHGVAVSSSLDDRRTIVYRLREVPASLKGAWDALVHAPPTYGGHETSVEDVVARAG
ncbi:SanA/YdcF family protein [Luteimicrobium subarcticum]|uniref:Vancomycin permeability regulator SanA n=1 Tax=Luteimicrobium subarcticum TaxID=620910 RepID=A0A2M8WQU4_9MICO|nr:ElyC/SanA/YdcF family protein [Luteimicrobium subarcticum]PJI93305.1 vancomycin permeability regulator SanA [Luteimicrobium subarcticum]